MKKICGLLVCAISLHSSAIFGSSNPNEASLEIGTSSSQSYGARSVVSNPAGLAYDTALNGAELGTSFSYGFNKDRKDDFGIGLAYGAVGFGAERFESFADPTTRYRLALGLPLSNKLYTGVRYSWWRTDGGDRWNDVALGAQWRLLPELSLGATWSQLNRPVIAGVPQEPLWIFGATFRPFDILELTLDGSTPQGSRFAKDWGYQGVIGAEIYRGVTLRAGYHSSYKFFAGIQIGIGQGTMYGSVQPDVTNRSAVIGFQGAMVPYRSPIGLPTTLKVKIDSDLGEQPVSASFLSAGRPSLYGLIERLQTAEDKPSVGIIAVDLRRMPLGMASALEIHNALMRLRQKGKRVEVFLGNAGMKEYLIASAASEIYLAPGGELRFLGLKAEQYFIKGTLDKIGLEGEFLAKGEYKSAPEMFTRSEASTANREAILDELKLAESELQRILQKARGINTERWTALRSLALISPETALKEKVIDGVKSFDSDISNRRTMTIVREDVSERSTALTLPPRIALIHADGNILNERFRSFGMGGDQVTPEGMQRKFDAAVNDPRVNAIVVRVNSPGGEILASDVIASQIRAAKERKPVLISFGDVAASGGYYIAAPGDKIYSNPLSITGSIGVFVGKFNAKGLYQHLKLNKEIFTHAPYPGLFTEDRPWSRGEREIVQRRLNEYYDSFIGFVSTSRNMPKDKVEAAAKGRVWLGTRAKELGLVDKLGGYREVLSDAAAIAGCALEECEVVTIREPAGFAEWISQNAFGTSQEFSILGSEEMIRLAHWARVLESSPYLYLSGLSSLR